MRFFSQEGGVGGSHRRLLIDLLLQTSQITCAEVKWLGALRSGQIQVITRDYTATANTCRCKVML